MRGRELTIFHEMLWLAADWVMGYGMWGLSFQGRPEVIIRKMDEVGLEFKEMKLNA